LSNKPNSYLEKNGNISLLLYDLQMRFLQIKAISETATENISTAKDTILLSRNALTLIDYAIFAMNALQTELPLTSISASAMAQDVAQDLFKIAQSYNIEIELDTSKKLEPIYANEAAVKGALFGLASSLIAAHPNNGKKSRFIISAQQTSPSKQRIGVYSSDAFIQKDSIKKIERLSFAARASAPKDMYNSGVGLLISRHLVDALGSELTNFTHKKQKGIGFYLPVSGQLSFL
jgi:hypothetical protein